MIRYQTHATPSAARLPREQQLAWQLAKLAEDEAEVSTDVTDMIANRMIDNAAVALASINRRPVQSARAMATAHPRPGGAALFGMSPETTVCAEWAAWANGTAVRELDFHDTFLAADYSHPADNIPPLLAVAQQCGCTGRDLARAIATAYEVHVALVKGICLHEHKIDHIAHVGPAVAAGLGTLLRLAPEITYQAIQQALHCTVTTRQSRKGEISSWKAFAPAYAGKTAIEAVDRAMRGEGAPSPIYEGEDSIISYILNGRSARERGQDPYAATYEISLPAPGEAKRAILETYTKEHSAEYQSQALIDLAFRIGRQLPDPEQIKSVVIHTSHHTHYVIGTGANDPQKMDPHASRETLDHSIMYIFAVALQDGSWHHVHSYSPKRASRPDTVRLWHKISTVEEPIWTERYHDPDPQKKAFGGRVVITLDDGTTVQDVLMVANAHPAGASPFTRKDYVRKFKSLTEDILPTAETERFLDLTARLPELSADELRTLMPIVPEQAVETNPTLGIFDA